MVNNVSVQATMTDGDLPQGEKYCAQTSSDHLCMQGVP